ncbi:MAG: energy-coupling factor ABC transporter ATP-binding protein [Lachnospiraceae bacterium]|nr:energy-coupling factor ABC transporter ATP-binding protein [Lachnospiraceae bacterium]
MIEFCDVSFSYAGDENVDGVKNINLKIKDGECVLLCGESGCGKTTVTRLVNGLIPHFYGGNLIGSVKYDGRQVSDIPLYDTAMTTGSVFQNPGTQFFNTDTDSELAFGCENLGFGKEEIKRRVESTVKEMKLEPLLGKSIFNLSGGEKQKIACGSVNALLPKVMVLDEPSSNLDVASISDLRNIIMNWKKQGKTIIVAEHRLYYLVDVADRIVYMKDGIIKGEFTSEELINMPNEKRRKMGLRRPTFRLEKKMDYEISGQGKKLVLKDFCFSYRKKQEALNIPSAEFSTGHVIAVIGRNGAGKSTFARCVCGLEKRSGILDFGGKKLGTGDRLKTCYMVMQDTGHQLFTESVLDEVLLSMEKEDEKEALLILERLDLKEYIDRHPQSLSGGQKQRLAIASALAAKKEIFVFDEPTSGLDFKHMEEVAAILRELKEKGKTIFVITHDIELIESCCTDVLQLEAGRIADQYPLDEMGEQKLFDFFSNRKQEKK